MLIRIILLTITSSIALSLGAITLDEAKRAYTDGDYAEAAPTLRAAADKEIRNTSLNLMAGAALMRSGKTDESIKYLERGGIDGYIYLAEIDFYRYHFKEATEHIQKYRESLRKAKKGTTSNLTDEAEDLERRINLGLSMLDRVEKVAVIDSFTVNRDDFFRTYKLSKPSGHIKSAKSLPQGFEAADFTSVFVTENEDKMIWAAPDTKQNYRLVESSQLADGTWEKPKPLDSGLIPGNTGDTNFPFLLSDGITLYYASDGEESLGGYDIFISRNDGDSYLQPQNIGMPYNSPYDDYLLAIDDITGAGWWATDRNRIPDKVTVYVFVPQELRTNYAPDTRGLESLAMLTSIAATRASDNDYSNILEAIDAVSSETYTQKEEFRYSMPGGKIYTQLKQFHSPAAQKAMIEYLSAQRKLTSAEKNLTGLRQRYSSGDKSTTQAILRAEKEIDDMRTSLIKLSNAVVIAETSKKR